MSLMASAVWVAAGILSTEVKISNNGGPAQAAPLTKIVAGAALGLAAQAGYNYVSDHWGDHPAAPQAIIRQQNPDNPQP